MLVGLSVAGLAVFFLALRAVLRSAPVDRKSAGLRAANRFRPTLVSAHRAERQERD